MTTAAAALPAEAMAHGEPPQDPWIEPAPGAVQPESAVASEAPAQEPSAAPEPVAAPLPRPLFPVDLPVGQPRMTTADLSRLMRQQGLDRPMAQAWVLDEVTRAIALPPEEEAALVAQFYAYRDLEDAEAAAAWRRRMHFSEADVLVRATKERRLALYRERCFGEAVEIRFLERKPDLDYVVYSILRLREEAIAEELYQRIREGEADFSELAPEFSLGMERDTRGQIGPVPLSTAHDELVRRLRVSRQGQLWKPFFVVDVWVVLRFERLMPAALNDEVRELLLEELFDDWFDERVRQLLEGEPLPALPLALLDAA